MLKRLRSAPQRKTEALPDLAKIPIDKPVRIDAALEQGDDHWLIRIPLTTGGNDLALYTRGISEIDGDDLVVRVPENLVSNLGLRAGQQLWIHNEGGRFCFEWEPEP